MSFTYNGNKISGVYYGGSTIIKGYYNSNIVFNKKTGNDIAFTAICSADINEGDPIAYIIYLNSDVQYYSSVNASKSYMLGDEVICYVSEITNVINTIVSTAKSVLLGFYAYNNDDYIDISYSEVTLYSGINSLKLTNFPNQLFSNISFNKVDITALKNNTNNSRLFFFSYSDIKTIVGLEYLVNSSVTNISGIFQNASQFTSDDLKGIESWDVSNCNYINSIFYNCSGLKTLNLSGWKASPSGSALNVFSGCSQLESLDISNFDLTKTQWVKLFDDTCTALKEVKVINCNDKTKSQVLEELNSCIKTSKWTLQDTGIITGLKVISRIYNSVTQSSDVSVNYNKTYASIPITAIATVTYEDGTIEEETTNTRTVVFFDKTNDTDEAIIRTGTSTYDGITFTWTVTQNYNQDVDYNYMFKIYPNSTLEVDKQVLKYNTENSSSSTANWQYITVTQTDVDNGYVTIKFDDSTTPTNIQFIENYKDGTYKIYVGKQFVLTDMSSMFSKKSYLTQVIFQHSVAPTSLNNTFLQCTKLSTLDLSNLDVSGCTNFASMLYGCSLLESFELDFGSNTDYITNCSDMLKGCTSLKTATFTNWKIESTYTNGVCTELFDGCTALTTIYFNSCSVKGDTYDSKSWSAAFSSCNALTEIHFTDCNDAFMNMILAILKNDISTKDWKLINNTIKELTVTSTTITSIVQTNDVSVPCYTTSASIPITVTTVYTYDDGSTEEKVTSETITVSFEKNTTEKSVLRTGTYLYNEYEFTWTVTQEAYKDVTIDWGTDDSREFTPNPNSTNVVTYEEIPSAAPTLEYVNASGSGSFTSAFLSTASKYGNPSDGISGFKSYFEHYYSSYGSSKYTVIGDKSLFDTWTGYKVLWGFIKDISVVARYSDTFKCAAPSGIDVKGIIVMSGAAITPSQYAIIAIKEPDTTTTDGRQAISLDANSWYISKGFLIAIVYQ